VFIGWGVAGACLIVQWVVSDDRENKIIINAMYQIGHRHN
jgi:hypothetical protein